MTALVSYPRTFIAWSLLLLLAEFFAVSSGLPHGDADSRRHHQRHQRHLVDPKASWRRSHVGRHGDVIRHKSHRRHFDVDDDIEVRRDTDKMAAEAINSLFGPRQFASVSSLHHRPAAAAKHDKPAPLPARGSHKHHRHQTAAGRNRKKGSDDSVEKTFKLELPVGCEAEPCQNDGDCYTDPASSLGYSCHCQPGFSGDFCEIDAFCQSEPCQNNGICTSKGTRTSSRSYVCDCVDGFSGHNCEIPPLLSSEDKSKETIGGLVSSITNTRNPVLWPLLSAGLFALLLVTFIACCICVEMRRNSLLKRYKLYKLVGLDKEFPMTSSVRLALRMTIRWLRCRCLKSSDDSLQQPNMYKPALTAALDRPAHNNAELNLLSTQVSEDSFLSETQSQMQAQQLLELQQLRYLQQLQMLQQNAYDAQQPSATQPQQQQQQQQQSQG